MNKKTASKKARGKKTRAARTTSKKSGRKRARPTSKRKVITDRKETVLSKVKSVIDDAAAGIKKLLPGALQPAAAVGEPRGGEIK